MSEAVANAAKMLAEPARAAVLVKLMHGRAVPAGELASAAHVSPQTASEHLARLTEAGFVTMQRLGRHRYYMLANEEVAHAVESLLVLSSAYSAQSRDSIFRSRTRNPRARPHMLQAPRRLARRNHHRCSSTRRLPAARARSGIHHHRKRKSVVRSKRHRPSTLTRSCRYKTRSPVSRLDRAPSPPRRSPRRLHIQALLRSRLDRSSAQIPRRSSHP